MTRCLVPVLARETLPAGAPDRCSWNEVTTAAGNVSTTSVAWPAAQPRGDHREADVPDPLAVRARAQHLAQQRERGRAEAQSHLSGRGRELHRGDGVVPAAGRAQLQVGLSAAGRRLGRLYWPGRGGRVQQRRGRKEGACQAPETHSAEGCRGRARQPGQRPSAFCAQAPLLEAPPELVDRNTARPQVPHRRDRSAQVDAALENDDRDEQPLLVSRHREGSRGREQGGCQDYLHPGQPQRPEDVAPAAAFEVLRKTPSRRATPSMQPRATTQVTERLMTRDRNARRNDIVVQ